MFGLERYEDEVIDVKCGIYGFLNNEKCMKFFSFGGITPL